MSPLTHPFFSFPIHEHTKDQYYRLGQEQTELAIRDQEQRYREQGSEMPEHAREFFRWRGEKPPWYHNDVVGFLDVGMDGFNSMTADVFFRRKHFPRGASQRFWPVLPIGQQRFLYCFAIQRRKVTDLNDNAAYVEACKAVLELARRDIKAHRKRFELCQLPFNLECFNFALAYQQIKGR
jgi:hypothetical protein